MKPDWVSDCGRVTLYCGDCLEVLPTLDKGSIDAVVTDPPFNAGKAFENDSLSPVDFQAFCDSVVIALHILSPQNLLIEVGKNDSIMRRAVERYFDFRYSICLNYTNSMRNGAIGYANWGLVLWFSRGGKCHSRYKDRIDSAVHSTIKEFKHPSPKEVEHYHHLCRMFTPENGAILDPFMGSGTTGVACIRTGRKFIGIELDPGYFAIAKKRIQDELAKHPLLETVA